MRRRLRELSSREMKNVIYCSSTNALTLIFFNSIQNSHVHEPSKLVENLQHLHITTEKNLTSNHCLKLKRLGFCVLKNIVLKFCWQHRSVSSVCFLDFYARCEHIIYYTCYNNAPRAMKHGSCIMHHSSLKQP